MKRIDDFDIPEELVLLEALSQEVSASIMEFLPSGIAIVLFLQPTGWLRKVIFLSSSHLTL